MAGSINVNQNNNNVTIQDQNGRLTITDNNTGNTINVTQPVTNVVTVATIGPQGQQGPIGPIPSSGSFTGAFTGSFSGSFTGSLQGTASNAVSASYALTASYLQGYISPFPFTGSARITGSLGVTGSISTTTQFYHPDSLDSANRALYDINGINSITWNDRTLINLNSSEALNWTDSDNITGITTIPISEQLDQQRIDNQLAAQTLIANGKIVTEQTIEQDARIDGTIVYYNGDVTEWQRLENSVIINSENPIDNILGIVIDQGRGSILLQGNITFQVESGNPSTGFPPILGAIRGGDPLYLTYSTGGYTDPVAFSTELPDGAVRSMGHILQSVADGSYTNGIISFNPSNDYSRILSGTNKIYQINGKDIYAISSSLAISSSFAATSSYLNTLNQNLTVTGSVISTGGFTGSFSGSVVAPGATTQIIYNNGGVLGANSGLVYSSSFVGINSPTPIYSLDVNGAIYQRTGELLITASGSVNKEGPFIASNGSARNIQLGILDNSVVPVGIDMFAPNNSFPSSYLNFRVNNADLVRMTGSFVGIGTTTPAASLHISGASSAALLEIDSPSLNNILFVTGSGRVGIGTNTPTTTLDVSGSGISLYDGFYRFNIGIPNNTAGPNNNYFSLFKISSKTYFNTFGGIPGYIFQLDGTDRIAIDNNGNLGIRALTPSASLHISGASSAALFRIESPASSSILHISGSGNIAIGSNNSFGYKLYVNGGSSYFNGILFVDPSQYLVSRYIYSGTGRNILPNSIETPSIVVGTTTANAIGVLHARGSGATSATTALRVENTNASASLTITDDGASTFAAQSNATPITITGYVATGSALQPALDITGSWNTSGAPTLIRANVTAITSNNSSLLMDLRYNGTSMLNVGQGGLVRGTFYNGGSETTNTLNGGFVRSGGNGSTSGISRAFVSNMLVSPTTGTAVFNQFEYVGIINQTGGANGITRGLYINPTLTSAADWRSIESTNGRVILTDTYSASGSLAGSILDISQTWNTAGTPTAIKLNATNTTSGVNSLLMDLQTDGVSRFRARHDGTTVSRVAFYVGANIASTVGFVAVNPTDSTTTITNTTDISTRISDFRNVSNPGYSYWFSSIQYSNLIYTSSFGGFINVQRGFAPTTGSGVFNSVLLQNTINQTGGANGITRGLLISPTLTAAADWRSIEFNNNTGWGIYGVGGATNYLSGSLGLGTTAPSYSLDVSGSTYSRRVLVGNDSGSSAQNDFYHRATNGGVYFTIRDSNNNSRLYFTGQSGTSQMVAVSQNIGLGVYSPTSTNRVTIGGIGATSATIALRVENSNTSASLIITDDRNSQFFGNVGIQRTATASLDIAGTTRLSGSFNTAISGSILTVQGSGSAQPIFTVQGSQGELFSITDSLSGSLFSVNDISGLPILEVFSDNTTLIGNYQDPMLITTAKVVQTNSGSFTVYSLPTASYDTAFFEYSVRSGSNARAGTIMAIQSGSAVKFTETTTTDFGSTSAVSFTVIVTGSNMTLTGSSTTGSWTIKTIVRGL